MEGEKVGEERKDSPGSAMVSDILCPAVHIFWESKMCTERAKGIADHYWPWAVFLGCDPIGEDDLWYRPI